ncbi:hypothetical protein MMC22_007006 [Lobaria immixta]|nr:hypothetical protein [Lobaria immixta]
MVCFPLAATTDKSEVIADLENGLKTLTRIFPFLNKQVVLEHDTGSQVTSSGTYKLSPRDDANKLLLQINQLGDDFPSYEQIRRARAPASMLIGSILAPMKSVPDMIDFSTPHPVLVIRANFVTGGLLLCFAGMHNAVDGSALGQLIRHFATACRGEKISDADVKAGNLARPTLFPPLRPGEPSQDHSAIHTTWDSNPPPNIGHRHASPWAYYRFPAAKLAALKRDASRKSTTAPNSSWISTNDALSALVWRAFVTARLPHVKMESTSTLRRAVNGRRSVRPAVPDGYMGVCVVDAFARLPVGDLVQKLHISDIALLLRKEIHEIDDYHLRSLVSFISSEPDKRNITFRGSDVMISSWAALPIYSSGFGEHLGTPEFVRRPTFAPGDGAMFIMPQNLEGDIDVVVSLKDGDFERLKEDPVWRAYADFIG